MNKLLLSAFFIGTSLAGYSQVGVGTTTPQGSFEVVSSTDGMLIPRVALTNTSTATILTPTKSELVYNTATTGDVTPGYYYWETTPDVASNRWVRLAIGNNSDWGVTGNAGTNPATNFAGTTDAQDFAIRTTNIERARITSGGTMGIGVTAPTGALDINSSTLGIVPPRVALTDITLATPVVNPQGGALTPGTFVWNTNTSLPAVPLPNRVAPGLYFWNGTRWVAFAGSPGGFDWSLKGNSGTNNGTDFLGTTDPEPLVIKVNSTERIRMGTSETVVNEDAQNYDFRVEGTGEPEMFFVDASTNHVHVRAASPFPTIDMFTSVGSANDYPLNGYASGQNSAGIYGQHTTDATGLGMNAGGAFDGAGGGYSNQPGWNVGVVGTGKEAGVYGTCTNPPTNTTARQGGLFSITNTANVVQPVASIAGYGYATSPYTDVYYGGFFDSNQSTNDYAYIGLSYNPPGPLPNADYGILSAGTKSTMVRDDEGKNRIMYCTEAPEVLFQDFGEGELVNGKATITLEDVLSKNISDKKPVKVFIQLEGDCNGVYITNKSNKGFTVNELNNGKSNTKFSWQIIGNRADVTDEKGNITSDFDDQRFPVGPERIKFPTPGVSKSLKK